VTEGAHPETGQKELTHAISVSLRSGIVLAVATGVAGGLIYLPHQAAQAVAFHHFAGSEVPYASLGGIRHALSGSANDRGSAIAAIGVLLLLLTPIVRVVLSLIIFLQERDLLFAGITAVVLGALGASVLIH
jgi:uncharacterized membrane protein